VILPVLVLLIVGLFDYGGAVNTSTKLNSAARAGLQYAMKYPADTAGIVYAARNATSDTTMTVGAPSLFCTCGSSTGAAVACGSTCAGTTLRYYVSLSTTQTYTPVVRFLGIGGPLTMTGAAVIQVQ
jgi:Flp pilus assembly protein TadG